MVRDLLAVTELLCSPTSALAAGGVPRGAEGSLCLMGGGLGRGGQRWEFGSEHEFGREGGGGC